MDFYQRVLRPFAMYRNKADLDEWDADDNLGAWKAAFTTDTTKPSGKLP